MDIDERIRAMTRRLEQTVGSHDEPRKHHEAQKQRIAALIRTIEIDAENISRLARVAEARGHR